MSRLIYGYQIYLELTSQLKAKMVATLSGGMVRYRFISHYCLARRELSEVKIVMFICMNRSFTPSFENTLLDPP